MRAPKRHERRLLSRVFAQMAERLAAEEPSAIPCGICADRGWWLGRFGRIPCVCPAGRRLPAGMFIPARKAAAAHEEAQRALVQVTRHARQGEAGLG